jgi:alkanesulfonate monooxygenase SsuD/methylene tetrahydromethanopterin reductase-like flavin-dependent oxidoreductase (luciferase family)
MELGFFTMPLHPADKDLSRSYREDREAILLADELGYSEAFVGEHVSDRAEPVTSCVVFLASLAKATRQIRLGTGTVNLPNGHPAAIAAQIAMLDHLLDGRLLFGISPGGLRSDMEVFGNLNADRTAMFVECIDQILAIWQGEPPYNLAGRFWNVTTAQTLMSDIGQGVIIKPLQQPHPPIFVTVVAPYSKGVASAAERGWKPISANFLQPTWVKTHWPLYAQGCEKGGHVADPADWRIAKSIFVADDDETARRYVYADDSPYRLYFRQLMRKLIGGGRAELFKHDLQMADADVTVDYVLDRLVLCGGVETVARSLVEFQSEVGEFGTLLYAGHDWVDAALGRRSMELMAREVMPRVNAATRTAGRPATPHDAAAAARASHG